MTCFADACPLALSKLNVCLSVQQPVALTISFSENAFWMIMHVQMLNPPMYLLLLLLVNGKDGWERWSNFTVSFTSSQCLSYTLCTLCPKKTLPSPFRSTCFSARSVPSNLLSHWLYVSESFGNWLWLDFGAGHYQATLVQLWIHWVFQVPALESKTFITFSITGTVIHHSFNIRDSALIMLCNLFVVGVLFDFGGFCSFLLSQAPS